jgi:hypothetical protein
MSLLVLRVRARASCSPRGARRTRSVLYCLIMLFSPRLHELSLPGPGFDARNLLFCTVEKSRSLATLVMTIPVNPFSVVYLSVLPFRNNLAKVGDGGEFA